MCWACVCGSELCVCDARVGFVCLLRRVLVCCVDVCGSCVHKHFVGSSCGVESPRAAAKGTVGS